MKLVIRTCAIAMLLAGILATSHLQASTVQPSQHFISRQAAPSLMPAPACPPDDPDGCGIGPNPKALPKAL